MTAPLIDAAPAIVAIPVGLAFGAALERAGLGSPRVIASQLAGRDFTVMKVMFIAITTAMLGIFWFNALGWLDLSRVAIPPTDIIPQVVGSVIFGFGFAIAALCPGTACAAAGAGRRDALGVIAGLFLGTLLVMLAWPLLGKAALSSLRPDATLPVDLGVPRGWIVAAITAMAVSVVWLTGRLETKGAETSSPRYRRPLAIVALVVAGAAVLRESAGTSSRHLSQIAWEIEGERDHVDPLELAEWIRDRKTGLRVIAIPGRDEYDVDLIPGSEPVSLSAIPALTIRRDELVVLYSRGGTHAAQAWVLLRTRGITNVRVLHDGLAGWEDEVMAPPLPRPGDNADVARFARARELARYFGGIPRAAVPIGPKPTSRRRQTC